MNDRRGQSRTLAEPECGWEEGLRLLVFESRCPWCKKRVENVSVTYSGPLTWECPEECNR